MQLDIRHTQPGRLAEAAKFFEENGYLRLSGLRDSIVPAFEQSLAEAAELSREALLPLLRPAAGAVPFDRALRQRLLRIETPPALARLLVSSLTPILKSLLGPLVHVSSTYHSQFKGGALDPEAADLAHYTHEGATDAMELHGAFRLHQDFTGASLPTSPSGLTLWVALNDCTEAPLRILPGSHRYGMYCNKMWEVDDPRLAKLGPALDIEARVGEGVLFHALLLHGTGKLGPRRRVSCDLRFFPLSGFLPSDVHVLDEHPAGFLRRRRAGNLGPVLLAPILEQLAFLGEGVPAEAAPGSPLNWSNYVVEVLRGRAEEALAHLIRFIDTDLLGEPESVLLERFLDRPLQWDRLEAVRARV
jgi:hypothetical protein